MPTLRLVLPQALITTWRHDLVYQLRVARYQKIRYYTKEENENGLQEVPGEPLSKPTKSFVRKVLSTNQKKQQSKVRIGLLENIVLGELEKPEQPGSRDDRGKRNIEDKETVEKATVSVTKPSLLEELFPEEVKKLKVGENESPSLLEELFPEEVKKSKAEKSQSTDKQDELLPLPLPKFVGLQDLNEADDAKSPSRKGLKTRKAAIAAFRQENPTVVVLSGASLSLSESDFRRVAPKGMHIEQWSGPGDIMTVIPSRDNVTLEPRSTYYLVFSNPANARTYQHHIKHLHTLASTHTPSSIESPMAPPPGMLIGGEDVNALLQDYTLCPPSQRISIHLLLPPYEHFVRNLLAQRGYSQIVQPENKSGRSVLFWVDGHRPSTAALKSMLTKDGIDRGTPWGPMNGKGSIEQIHKASEPLPEDLADEHALEDGESRPSRRKMFSRWVIAFEHESEARRFVRLWSRRPYPFPVAHETPVDGEPTPLVHAEFLW